ncbi:MAG: hypothetical protein ABSE73_22860 [Planctomycetota bacterium]
MKATLDIEPELYAAAKQLARSQKKSLGQVVSALLRKALGLSAAPAGVSMAEIERRNGFDVFPERSGPQATSAAVQQLCREEGI